MRLGRISSSILAAAIAAVVGLGSVGCAASSTGPKTLSYTEDARRAYEEAMQSFRSKDW
ncbi:MAG: outer membrane protein assembly factor BamD, partial [Myxococcales bacterium]|nr:outer membrane protein assembly factor BamD [Myxococcales bacterium]